MLESLGACNPLRGLLTLGSVGLVWVLAIRCAACAPSLVLSLGPGACNPPFSRRLVAVVIFRARVLESPGACNPPFRGAPSLVLSARSGCLQPTVFTAACAPLSRSGKCLAAFSWRALPAARLSQQAAYVSKLTTRLLTEALPAAQARKSRSRRMP